MGGVSGLRGAHVDSAAASELDPSVSLQLPISRADRVGMQMKTPRQFASAGQALARRQIVAQNAEHDLRDQLFANRDFTASGKPELHGGNIISLARAG